jgi:hypothetical protein
MFEELFENEEEYKNALKVRNARQYLNDTDYIANKMVEYQFLGKELDKDYTETLKKREEAREVIRNYEK